MEKLTQVMAIGSNSWGKGKSVEDALRSWHKNFGSLRRDSITIALRVVSEDAYVNEMGTLYANRIEALPDITFTKADFEAVFEGHNILMDLIHGFEISDRVYDLKESEIEDEF